MSVGAITVNEGTQSNILTDTAGTQEIGVIKIDTSAAGTYGNLWGGNVGVASGTINSLPNLPQGSINVTAGTITEGTLRNLISGTINSATAVLNSGTINVATAVITTLPNLPQGSINVTAGTITEGTLRNLISGTINAATAVLNSGTINVGTFVFNSGTVSVLPNLPQGSINVTAGTIGGKAASGAAAVGNPVLTAGTDSGGTIYSPLIDTKGQQYLGGGTVSMLNAGTITNVLNGSIVMTAGTVAAHAITAATITAGTLTNLVSGTINAATAVLNSGTINVGTFVFNTGTVSVLPNLPQGSINVTAGTINTGTINTGTINVGTFVMTVGTVNHGTIDAGTVRVDARTTQNIVSYGTNIANSGAAAATIVGSASVGAGTSLWLQDISVLNPNSAAATVILGFGTTQQGTNVLFRGILGTNGAVGIEKPFAKAVNAGMTNQDLVFSTTGAGTVDLTISYFISA